jgi:hypothetical protein
VLFVLTLTMGASFRIASEEEIDGNTIVFGTIVAIEVTIALSLFNKFVIDFVLTSTASRRLLITPFPEFSRINSFNL